MSPGRPRGPDWLTFYTSMRSSSHPQRKCPETAERAELMAAVEAVGLHECGNVAYLIVVKDGRYGW
jgi:hypothetical protein